MNHLGVIEVSGDIGVCDVLAEHVEEKAVGVGEVPGLQHLHLQLAVDHTAARLWE